MEKRPLTFSLFMLRLLSGIVGGATGLLCAFIIFFLMQSFAASDESGSLSAFVIIIMAFVGTLVANTMTGVMVTFMDNGKYSRRKTTIMHIFLFNLILFFLTIPLYLMAINLDIVEGVAATHFLLSAFISALIMEILAGYEFSLLGVYGAALGIFISIGIALMILVGAGPKATTVLMFGAMPAVWLILMIIGGFSELIYDNFLKFYGIDALNVRTDLGGDTEEEMESEEDEDGESTEDDEDESFGG